MQATNKSNPLLRLDLTVIFTSVRPSHSFVFCDNIDVSSLALAVCPRRVATKINKISEFWCRTERCFCCWGWWWWRWRWRFGGDRCRGSIVWRRGGEWPEPRAFIGTHQVANSALGLTAWIRSDSRPYLIRSLHGPGANGNYFGWAAVALAKLFERYWRSEWCCVLCSVAESFGEENCGRSNKQAAQPKGQHRLPGQTTGYE